MLLRLNLTTQGMALPALVFLVTALGVTLESLQAEAAMEASLGERSRPDIGKAEQSA